MPEYWTPELETRPWPELERWQAGQATAMLAPLRRRSLLYARLHAGVPDDLVLRSAADLAALPFTFKDDLRAAQEAATDERPSATTRPRRRRRSCRRSRRRARPAGRSTTR